MVPLVLLKLEEYNELLPAGHQIEGYVHQVHKNKQENGNSHQNILVV